MTSEVSILEASFEDKKNQIESELRLAQESFYKGKSLSKNEAKVLPHYADYVLSNSEDSSCGLDETKTPTLLPTLSAVFERVEEIVPSKQLDTEHTIVTAKPKKQKKKRNTKQRINTLIDVEPIKQIEIIRSQPEAKTSSKVAQQSQEVITSQTVTKNPKAKRKA